MKDEEPACCATRRSICSSSRRATCSPNASISPCCWRCRSSRSMSRAARAGRFACPWRSPRACAPAPVLCFKPHFGLALGLPGIAMLLRRRSIAPLFANREFRRDRVLRQSMSHRSALAVPRLFRDRAAGGARGLSAGAPFGAGHGVLAADVVDGRHLRRRAVWRLARRLGPSGAALLRCSACWLCARLFSSRANRGPIMRRRRSNSARSPGVLWGCATEARAPAVHGEVRAAEFSSLPAVAPFLAVRAHRHAADHEDPIPGCSTRCARRAGASAHGDDREQLDFGHPLMRQVDGDGSDGRTRCGDGRCRAAAGHGRPAAARAFRGDGAARSRRARGGCLAQGQPDLILVEDRARGMVLRRPEMRALDAYGSQTGRGFEIGGGRSEREVDARAEAVGLFEARRR